jgi:hypothetical protein
MSQAAEWKRLTIGWAVILLVAAVGCLFIKGNALTLHEVQTQDAPVLALLAVTVSIAVWKAPSWRLPSRPPPWWALLLIGLAMVCGLAAGAYAVFDNYPLARDEHMVVFDMAVYGTGRLAMPLAPFWRPFASALVPDFLLNDRMPAGLVSDYLPVNAWLRLAFSKLADPIWLNPLLALGGAAALLDVARRTFGPDQRAVWATLLVFVLSAQMLVNAMTPFSVTAHMALNLIWLSAFLRGGKLWTAVAIAVGFLATGLHQIAFHPLFVAPFLLWRLAQGQWRVVLVYGVGYAAIGLWWIYFPHLPQVQTVSAANGQAATAGASVVDRLLPMLLNRTPGTTGLMVLNLLRFVAWQNFALVPLLIAALPAIRQRGLPSVLAVGVLLWLAFLALLMPYQGLGWGYRYLSPYFGSFALLSGYGYQWLEQRWGTRADGMVILSSAVTLVAAIPMLLITTHRFAAPYIALDRYVARQNAPLVVIDTTVSNPPDEGWAQHPLDQVRNLPDLSNRPLRFSGNRVNAAMIEQLCGRSQVTIVRRADMHRVGFMLNVPATSPDFERMMQKVEQARPGCLRNPTVQ